LVSFIGLYLGVVFLISAAAIMALKELSESTDNIERYCMLRKLGADEKMIHKALFRQIGIFFAMPLALAILHSIFGMKFSMIFLAVLGTSGMTVSIVTTAVILALIYGGYFVLTYVCSKNMIKC
jgi:putative ABC transport system permease protein